MKKSLVAVASVLFLFAGILLPCTSAQAETSSPLVTCINLVTKVERISHSGKCRITQEAQANWHLLRSDSSLPNKEKSTTLTVCSNKPTSPVSYQIIRAKCASHQIRTDFYRSTVLATAPTITKVVATGYESAQVSIAQDPNANPDAPVAYYTIASSKGQSKNVYTWGELNLPIENLAELTTYSFTVTATTADGTSRVSASSDSVTTSKYVALPVKSSASPVAQVSLLSSDTAAVTIPAGATSVAIAAPTLGNPSLSFGSQGAAVSATITSAANPVGSASTPFTVSGSTKIVDISVSGLSGSATVCLDASPTAKLWHYVGGAWVDITSSHTSTQVCGLTSSFSPFTGEEQLAAPAFTLSVSSRSGNQGSAITAVTATKSSHSQSVTYSISPALPTGLSINSTTGTISGTPTVTSSATDYVITATNAAGGTATQTLSIALNAAIPCASGGPCALGAIGPGGGVVFYVSNDGFNCGATWSSTGSPTGGLCHYLEAAPTGSLVSRSWGDKFGSRIAVIPGIEYFEGLNRVASLGIENIGKGFINSDLTAAIYSSKVAYAAAKARDYNLGGKSDWYLPNNAELYQSVSYFPAEDVIYWSSTEATQASVPVHTGSVAWVVETGRGLPDGFYVTYNNESHLVRPIRAF